MDSSKIYRNYLELLKSPVVPQGFPTDQLYQFACTGAIASLSQDIRENPDSKTEAAVSALKEIVSHAAAERFRESALEALKEAALSGNPMCRDALFQLATVELNPAALKILEEYNLSSPSVDFESAKYFFLKNKNDLLRNDPTLNELTRFYLAAPRSVRQEMQRIARIMLPNWGNIVEFLQDPKAETSAWEKIQSEFLYFSETEKELLIRQLLGQSVDAQKLIADLFLRYDDPALLRACLSNQLEPSRADRKALFYFLSDQWTQYERNDLDYQWIRKAFSEGSDFLRNRLIRHGLKSGHTSWLETSEFSVQTEHVFRPISFSQWESWVTKLIAQSDWERLWQILPIAPVALVPEVITALQRENFEPQSEEERDFFRKLIQICSELPPSIPVPFVRRFYNQTSQPFLLNLSKDGNYLAAAFLNGDIRFWNLGDRTLSSGSLQIPNLSPKAFCFGENAETLASAWSDNVIRIFRFPSAVLLNKLPPAAAPVTNLFLSVDGRRIYATEQPNFLQAWGYPAGIPLDDIKLPGFQIIRSSVCPENNRLVFLDDHQSLFIFDIRKKQTVAEINPFPPQSVLDTSSELLTCVSLDQHITVWNLNSQMKLSDVQESGFSGKILSIAQLIPGEVAVFGSQIGECAVCSLHSGKHLAEIHGNDPFSSLSAIRINTQDNQLYLADSDGSITQWDLTLLRQMISIFHPETIPNPEKLRTYQQKFFTPAVQKTIALMNILFDWRTRYDIEVEFDE
ncbi:MAG TPA: WD40 repeat domain-containing protein [Flexilinea sp.]|nr:WD40 repeat domain-containing protein [Flexilinea sp.]